jgi:hypothetical protein
MNVGELRKALEDLPDDLLVFYEDPHGLSAAEGVYVAHVQQRTGASGISYQVDPKGDSALVIG